MACPLSILYGELEAIEAAFRHAERWIEIVGNALIPTEQAFPV